MSGETKTKEYLENRQPFGQVPALVRVFFRVDRFTERWSICRRTTMGSSPSRAVPLLATEQYGNGKLLPEDLNSVALSRRYPKFEV